MQRTFWIICITTITLAGIAMAQQASPSAPEGQAMGVGSAVIRKSADRMLMYLELRGEGKDIKDAMAKIQQREQDARKKLVEIGADEKSIKMTVTGVGASASPDQKAMMRRMLSERMGKKSEKPTTAPAVEVSGLLKAEWALKAGDNLQVLMASAEISDKVRASDLSGSKALTPEEQEQMEEAMSEVRRYGNENAMPGQPRFIYTATVSDEEQAKSLADAMAIARADAQRVAKAAGVELGSIRMLRQHNSDVPMMDEDSPYYRRRQYGEVQVEEDQPANVIGGASPIGITRKVAVTATYAIKN